ncbi:OTU domain-containing protein OS=Streptomyces fumanus OX=67302 GN=GCM10018772_56770 PE=4 SV=1 [Streptomyces fumanus]
MTSRCCAPRVENPAVTDALSHDPTRFDAVPDAELQAALRATRRPTPGTPAAVTEAASPVAAARAASPALDTVLAAEPALTAALAEDDFALARVLARRPAVLAAPHEFRRLLGPGAAGVRAAVREGSPLLAPPLRAALAAPRYAAGCSQ